IDDALESLTLSGVDAERDDVLALHDTAEASEVGLRAQHAAVAHALIFRAVVAVPALRVVGRRLLVELLRDRTLLPPPAAVHLVLARVGVLKERQTELAVKAVPLLHLRRQRRDAAVWRIDDERRPSARRFDGGEHRVVRAGDVLPASDLSAFVAADIPRTLLVLRGALFVGEELFVRVSSGALERRIEFIEPNALKIGMAPRCFGNRALFSGFR